MKIQHPLETMIAMGLSIVIFGAMTTMLINLQKSVSQLKRQQEVAELKFLAMEQFKKLDVCQWQFTQPGMVINVSGVTSQRPSRSVLKFQTLYYGLSPSSAVLARAGHLLPGTQTGLTVDDIEFGNIVATGVPNEYKGTLRISFESRLGTT